jgi:hypothetical protein
MLGRESLYRMEKKCVGRCAWQKCYNEKVMVKFNYNVDKYIQRHWNTLKHTINALKYIIGTLKYTMNVLQVHWNTLKYTINVLKYIHILSNTLKDIEIHYTNTIHTSKYIQVHSNTFKYIDIYYKYIELHHKCTISALKYIKIYYKYIKIHSYTFKYFERHWNTL